VDLFGRLGRRRGGGDNDLARFGVLKPAAGPEDDRFDDAAIG
jgi:hypothetical protein